MFTTSSAGWSGLSGKGGAAGEKEERTLMTGEGRVSREGRGTTRTWKNERLEKRSTPGAERRKRLNFLESLLPKRLRSPRRFPFQSPDLHWPLHSPTSCNHQSQINPPLTPPQRALPLSTTHPPKHPLPPHTPEHPLPPCWPPEAPRPLLPETGTHRRTERPSLPQVCSTTRLTPPPSPHGRGNGNPRPWKTRCTPLSRSSPKPLGVSGN